MADVAPLSNKVKQESVVIESPVDEHLLFSMSSPINHLLDRDQNKGAQLSALDLLDVYNVANVAMTAINEWPTSSASFLTVPGASVNITAKTGRNLIFVFGSAIKCANSGFSTSSGTEFRGIRDSSIAIGTTRITAVFDDSVAGPPFRSAPENVLPAIIGVDLVSPGATVNYQFQIRSIISGTETRVRSGTFGVLAI